MNNTATLPQCLALTHAKETGNCRSLYPERSNLVDGEFTVSGSGVTHDIITDNHVNRLKYVEASRHTCSVEP